MWKQTWSDSSKGKSESVEDIILSHYCLLKFYQEVPFNFLLMLKTNRKRTSIFKTWLSSELKKSMYTLHNNPFLCAPELLVNY